MSKMVKKRTDWGLIALYIVAIIFAISIIMLLASLSGNIKPLDVIAQTNTNGTVTLTFTGISEIIIAVPTGIASAIGTYMKLTKKK